MSDLESTGVELSTICMKTNTLTELCAVTCEADLRLCFRICEKTGFLMTRLIMEYDSIKTTINFFRFYLLNQQQHKITIKKERKKAMK